MKYEQTQFPDEHVHVWLDIQVDLGQRNLDIFRRRCFHLFDHSMHSCVRHLFLHLLQVCHFVGARQQDVKTAVTRESKPRHL